MKSVFMHRKALQWCGNRARQSLYGDHTYVHVWYICGTMVLLIRSCRRLQDHHLAPQR